MSSSLEGYDWDEDKRLKNLLKHGLDFKRAYVVLSSRYRLDVNSYRNGEKRVQSMSYVSDVLRVLTVVHLSGERKRIISFRTASKEERDVYFEWLKNHDHDAGRNEGSV